MGCQGNGKGQDKNTNQEGPMFRKLEILFHKYLLGKSYLVQVRSETVACRGRQ